MSVFKSDKERCTDTRTDNRRTDAETFAHPQPKDADSVRVPRNSEELRAMGAKDPTSQPKWQGLRRPNQKQACSEEVVN